MKSLINIKSKDEEFIKILKNRYKKILKYSGTDCETITNIICESHILENLLNSEKKEIEYESSKTNISKEAGYAWRRPVLKEFDKYWEEYSKIAKLDSNSLRKRFEEE